MYSQDSQNSQNSQNNNTNNIDDILFEALERPVEALSPGFKKNAISDIQITQVLDGIVTKYPTLSRPAVLSGTILLFLKGAAANNTPDNLSVEVDGITITKRDLKHALQNIVNHQYLRRLGESLAVQIGRFAERNHLDGELANRIAKMVAQDNLSKNLPNTSLTVNERAWSSSFSQSIKNLSEYTTPRVVSFLALDYSQRFGGKSPK